MCVILALALMTTFTLAQTTTSGAIAGTVNDPSGAAVPSAKISVTNTGTNDKVDTTSNSVGEYRVSNLTPGVYSVSVSAQGFGAYKASVTVEVSRIVTFDPKLSVGSAKGETVEVNATTQAVNTESQEVSSNFGSSAIENLPINGRRWSNYALLSPTANPDGTFGLMSFRGISGLLNNFTVDGGDNNNNFYAEERGRTRLTYSTSQDSIQEFQLTTSNYSAQYGRSAGGTVNAVTKSGSNQFHGSGYWYDRNNALGAFNPSVTLNSQPYKPVDVRYIFGATIGGPIYKDKAFFFFNWDEFRRNFPGDSIPQTSSAANNPFPVNGQPFTPLTAAAAAATVCPASNTTAFNTLTGLNVGQQFYCRFGQNLATGNAAMLAGFNYVNNLLGVVTRRGDQRLFLPRVDVKLFGGNMSTSFNWLSWNSPNGIQTQPTNTIATDEFGNDIVKVKTLNMNYNKPLNNSTSIELKYHWSKEHLEGSLNSFVPGQPSVAGPDGSQPPGVSLGGWLAFGTQTSFPRPNNPDETQNQGSVNLTKTIGRHTIKTGLEILSNNEFVNSVFNGFGTYSYSSSPTAFVNFVSDAYNSGSGKLTGNPGTQLCDGNLGAATNVPVPCYSSFLQTIGTPIYQFSTKDYAAYFQDDFRIKPRLTLNLGIRYEFEQYPQPIAANPALPNTANHPSDKNNFGPRMGFSWDVMGNGKLAVRGGYGLYYARTINSVIAAALTGTGLLTGQPVFSITNTTLIGAAPQVYPNILSTTLPPLPPNVVFFDPHLLNPYIHQGDIIVEYEVAKDTVASFSYIVSKGRKLVSFLDTNLPATYQGNVSFTESDSGLSFTVPSYGNQARPNLAYNQITDIGNQVTSDYYAYVAQLNKRMSKGLMFTANYTYSKATDNGQGSQTFSTANNAFDPNNLALEKGISNFDFTHKFVVTAVWQPIYFKDKGRGLHYIMDGWTFSPIEYFSSGAPYTGFASGFLSNSSTVGSNTTICLNTHVSSGSLNCAQGNGRVTNIPRNAYRMTNRNSIDMRVGRSVGFGSNEKYKIEFNAEAFNLFNHQNVTGVSQTQYILGACSNPGPVVGALISNNLETCTLSANSGANGFGSPNTISGGTNLRERQIQFSLRFKF